MMRQVKRFGFCLAIVSAIWAGDVLPVNAQSLASSVDAAALPKHKRTFLGLYLTPNDSFQALQSDPSIVYIDVRDPIEIAFTGHAQGTDAIVPVALATHNYDVRGKRYKMAPNKAFLAQVDAVMAREGLDKSSPIIVACRSGGRSARAVQMLAKAGYTAVYNQIEGFEGDWNKATHSRDLNGWRNAGLPWSMAISPNVAWRPEAAN